MFWTVEGHIPIRPKTDGMGIMVSLLIIREFGFTFNLMEENLNRKAVMELYGTTEKNSKEENILSSNPFYRDFEYGKTRSGYWDSSHAAIQLEDATDFFFTLFSPNAYQLVYELDHSQAHKKFSEDTHVVKHFNLHPGGSVPFVRSLEVSTDSVGPYYHEHILKPGDIMHHTFSNLDPPPRSKPTMP